jgi:hypothetical protein
MARIARRRRPDIPPTVAAVGLETEQASEADAVLEGLDLDDELRRLLSESGSVGPKAGPEPEGTAGLVSTRS